MPGWKVPEVAFFNFADIVAVFLVERGDTDFAFEDISPFAYFVPVELKDGAFVKTHVYAGELDACWELADSGLTGPAAFLTWCDIDTGQDQIQDYVPRYVYGSQQNSTSYLAGYRGQWKGVGSCLETAFLERCCVGQ